MAMNLTSNICGRKSARHGGLKKSADVKTLVSCAVIAKQVGCGRPIVWKDQAIVPIAEVDAIFSTQELELILSNFSSNNTDFIAKKQSREKNVPVFAKLDSNGKDIDP